MKKIRVLVVDDASFMRDMVKRGVRAGFPAFEVDEAPNGRKALGMLEKNPYDLVLCDWEMPEMSGAELLKWLRENEATRDIPFVMITSRGDRENVMQAVELKVNNYIVKPFTNEKLANVVGSVMSKALGINAEALKKISGVATSGGASYGNDSLSILTAHHSPAAARQAKEGPLRVQPRGKVVGQLRFSDETVTCLIRELSEEMVLAVVRRADSIPRILDLAVLDIQLADEVARLNGYVHTLQAREDSQESEFINITIHFVDRDDAQKMDLLRRYMASIVG